MNNREFIERKTKILATLGPSSNTIKKIIELSKAGANAFRLNCSHLNEKDLEEYIYKIRRAEIIIKKPIGILVDLQGPKIRIGNVSNNQNILKKGDIFVLDNIKETGNNKRVYYCNNWVTWFKIFWIIFFFLYFDCFISINKVDFISKFFSNNLDGFCIQTLVD